jgi:hypothetical protein
MKKKTKVGNLQVDEDVGGRMTPKWYLEVPTVIEGTTRVVRRTAKAVSQTI